MLYVLAVAAALTILEWVSGANMKSSRLTNVEVWLFNKFLALLFVPLVTLTMPVSLVRADELPFWQALIFWILLTDLLAYLFHRAQHSIPFMWAMHSLHHSDEDMNVTTTERHFWGDQFLKAVTTWPVAALILTPTPEILALNGLLTIYNFVPHSNIKLSFGWWSWLLNSPAYHRRHHSILPEHYNSNYAAIFPIWDVLFGTYRRPEGFPPTGLDRKPYGPIDWFAWPLLKSSHFERRKRAAEQIS